MEVMIQSLWEYFYWDWSWSVVVVTAICTVLFNICTSPPFIDMGDGSLLAVFFIILLFIPLVIPIMAWFGNDFWLPLFTIILLYAFFFQGFKNEAGLGIIWHFMGLITMVPLAVIVRAVRYFDGS
jgi:hypothetical protein